MSVETDLDRQAILEKFASLRRLHMEVGRKQTEDYQKRLEKLKEEESSYLSKFVAPPTNEELSTRSARRDLFLSSKMEPNPPVQSSSYRPTVNDWNVADDFHPLNLTDNDLLDDRRSNHDDEPEETYLTAFHQLLQTQHDLINHQVHEPENMLSTILEASCEEATPMTSLVDVHQTNNVEEEEEEISEDEATERPMNPPSSIDDVPVLTVFSKNENLKYSDYVLQKLQNEKEQAFSAASSNATKEKRPFLRRRQGLAHYQAPPKRRQRPVIDESTTTKTEPTKRPTSASNTRHTANASNPRPRSNSSSSSSTRPTKTAKPTKPSITSAAAPAAGGNLLGQVELDDDDDLLTKHPTKLSSQLQNLIDFKWNSKEKVPQIDEKDHRRDEEDEVFSTISQRQRTSSRTSSTGPTSKPKHELDEFEKLEQYAEEHPSMLSTVSYVEQVVFKDHPSKGHFLQGPVEEEEEDEGNESHPGDEMSNHSHRIRQRKIKPLKSKPSPPPLPSDDEEDEDEEEDRWDDVGVAQVIPVLADEYNSDSGISSLRTEFSKRGQIPPGKKDPSDFGDEQSWMDRTTVPGHNTLMLKTFPGLRQTKTTTTPVPPPPPPPPSAAPVAQESNSDLSRLMREKSKELEKQIEIFQKENAKLESLCNERNLAIKKLKQDRDEFEKTKQRELEEFEKMKEEEMKKLRQEKRLFEQHRQQLRDHPDKREREEIEALKKQVVALQEDLKQRESRWSATVNRLKERLETLEYENAELKQEKEIIERKRLDLMHQVQTLSMKTPIDDPPASSRRSLVEQVTTKRPKSIAPTTTKTQSVPKTMVVRNSEPPSMKNKVTTTTTNTGRKTPTNAVGVNGIKNNVDTSRKLSSMPTKRSVSMNEFVGSTERVDSGNGESDEEVHRSAKNDDFVSPPLSQLVNSEYSKSHIDENVDYKSLLTMANRTSSSATTLLQQHQVSLSKQSPRSFNPSSESVLPIPRVSIPVAKSFPSQSIEQSTEEIRHQDGRIERVKADGSRTIQFPNGSKQEISADGQHIRVYFYNGDFKEKMADGRCVYKYASTNTIETEYPDGTRVCEFSNGQIEKHFPDGRQEHVLPDRTKNIYLPDGTIITLKTNGEKFIQHTNQTKEIHTDTFKRKLFPNGSILTVFNTGEQEVRYANGKIKLKDAQGNVIMEKKSGTNH